MSRAAMGAALERRIALMAPARRLRLATTLAELEHYAAGRSLRVLDAGCGDGLLTLEIARRHPGWEVVGIDMRDDLLAGAQARALARGITNASFLVGDLTAPPQQPRSFDAVIAVECLSEIPQDRLALKMLADALLDGGLLLAHVPERSWRPVLRGSSPVWREEVRHGYSAEEIAGALRQAGLTAVRVAGTFRGTATLAQELRDRFKDRSLRVRALAFPAMVAAVWLERHGATWGEHRALVAVGCRPGDADPRPRWLPQALTGHAGGSRRELFLRRLVLALRLPAAALVPLGWIMPAGRRQLWSPFTRRIAFWQEVRSAVGRRRFRQLSAGVPVLAYHAFSERGSAERYVVSRRRFARQMRVLALLGYRVADFEALGAALRQHRLEPRTAVITIDDGYADNLRIAAPVLRKHGFRATVFLVSGRLGKGNDWATVPSLKDRPLLSAEQVSAARNGLLRFGAHTRTHCPLTGLAPHRIEEEVSGSRDDLQRVLGEPVETFAYPHGSYDERVAAAVRDSGFLAAGTTDPRLLRVWDSPFLIPRIEIFGTDSLARFLLKLWFGEQ